MRVNSEMANKTEVNVKDHEGKTIRYRLLSLPFYLVPQIHRLIDEVSGG